MNENLAFASELTQCGFLVGTFISNIVLNYVPYQDSRYGYRKVGKNYYAIKLPDPVENINYSQCTNLTQNEFDTIMSLKGSDSMGNFIKAQYWICFLVIGSLQIFAWYNRRHKKVESFTFKIILVGVKIFFAPSIFAVSIIDYKSQCIYLGVDTFFIYVASFANGVLFVIFFCIFCINQKTNDQNAVILLVFGIYAILASIIYVAIYLGPLFTKLENVALTLNMVLDAISAYFS
jgi:hypothetical protein